MAETVLVVVRPFGWHAVGELIEDPACAAEIAAGEYAHNVVRVAAARARMIRPQGV